MSWRCCMPASATVGVCGDEEPASQSSSWALRVCGLVSTFPRAGPSSHVPPNLHTWCAGQLSTAAILPRCVRRPWLCCPAGTVLPAARLLMDRLAAAGPRCICGVVGLNGMTEWRRSCARWMGSCQITQARGLGATAVPSTPEAHVCFSTASCLQPQLPALLRVLPLCAAPDSATRGHVIMRQRASR